MGSRNVFILTYCRNIDLLYSTELVFKTLRRGFPNSRVHVFDNASLPEARTRVERLCAENDCAFTPIPSPGIGHHDFIGGRVLDVAEGRIEGNSAVFVDPDICLWRDCEGLEFARPIAGNLVEAHEDPVMQCVTLARLHTSFLWIDDCAAVADRISSVRRRHIDFQPFQPFSARLGDAWLRWDTGASLFSAMPDLCVPFTEEHASYYDHLYAGSHFDSWVSQQTGAHQALLRQTHQWAKEGNLDALRGIWKRQAEAWRSYVRPLVLDKGASSPPSADTDLTDRVD